MLEVGLLPEGIAALKTASMLEPHLYRAKADVARARALLGDYGGVDEVGANMPEEPGDQNIYWFYLARMCMWRRDAVGAATSLARVQESTFPLKLDVAAIFDLVSTGAVAEAVLKGLERWGAIVSRAHRRPLFFRQLAAEVNALRGDVPATFEALESAVSLSLLDIGWLDRCPLFDPHRSEPRFLELRKPVVARADEVKLALRS